MGKELEVELEDVAMEGLERVKLQRVACKALERPGMDKVGIGELVVVRGRKRRRRVKSSKEGVRDGERGSGRAGQSVFNWLCRLEGQRSRAQHAAVTLHYSHWPHNESPRNQLPTDQSLQPHTHTHTQTMEYFIGNYQACSLLTHLSVFPDSHSNTHT